MTALLEIDDLTIALPSGADRPYALEHVSLSVNAGEILCIVGESGSGKSMTASAILGLLPERVRASAGSIRFAGRDLLSLSEQELRSVRGPQIGMIFQEPMTALNPLKTIGDRIGEMFRAHSDLKPKAILAEVLRLLQDVNIPDPKSAAGAYPHELSGGQRQRAMIAMALALEPAFLIADEPTTALDVTTQAQILALIRNLQRRRNMGVLFITHDFGVVADIADRVAVMQSGKLVEIGIAKDILDRPTAAYTKSLIAAVPSIIPPPPRPISRETILDLHGVTKTFASGGFFSGRRVTHAVKGVTLSLPRGSTLGIVGESGSGKSTLARCIMRLLDPDSGSIRLEDLDLAALNRKALRAERGRIQMVFQDPYGSLNPRRRVGELVAQGPMLHGVSRREAMQRAAELFALVGLSPGALDRFPHEFSGGQRQRIGLARALALRPQLLVADEPVSALDVSVQAQVLRLLADLRERLQLSMLFITHDLRVAAQICDRIAVMKNGELVEIGDTAELFAAPQHAYTRALLDAVPGRRSVEKIADA